MRPSGSCCHYSLDNDTPMHEIKPNYYCLSDCRPLCFAAEHPGDPYDHPLVVQAGLRFPLRRLSHRRTPAQALPSGRILHIVFVLLHAFADAPGLTRDLVGVFFVIAF